ncbi:hypothetical protein RvY_00485 [Ramazzottius varieornatus]|uniref:Uncharacterized protein n=1 Tax=Ramazzottius varieornatus TaxID=947166 RepID=A0A1D1UDW2_RAMVA|nr:hypothetical protein RvY_00485 [Ramazzottius varieornatus]
MVSRSHLVAVAAVLVTVLISGCESRAIRVRRAAADDSYSDSSNDLNIGPRNRNRGATGIGGRNCGNAQTYGGAGGNSKGGNNPQNTGIRNSAGGRGGVAINDTGCGAKGGSGGSSIGGRGGDSRGGAGGLALVTDYAFGR